MSAGKYNRYITLKRPVKTESSFGDAVTTWATVGQVWASMEPLKGREIMLANQLSAPQDIRIRMRYHTELIAANSTWRAEYAGVLYNITTVANVNQANIEYELMCITGVNDG